MATADVRAAVTAALDLADALGVTVEGCGADLFGDAYLYCWETPADVLAAALGEDWELIREDTLLTWKRGTFGNQVQITCKTASQPADT